MKKYNSIEDIEQAYRYKVARAKWWLTTQLKYWDEWVNKKVRIVKTRVPKEKRETGENIRQGCMELLQVNCRMAKAVEYNSITIKCYSCPKALPRYHKMAWWHRTWRKNKRVCIHPMNINPQCFNCNNNMREYDDDVRYAYYNQTLINEYWKEEYDKFNELSKNTRPCQIPIYHRSAQRILLQKENVYLKQKIQDMWLWKP